MKKITIRIPEKTKTYDIEFPESYSALRQALKSQIGDKKALIITDENISGFNFSAFPNVFVLPSGEEHKNWETVNKILNHAFQKEFDRSCIFVAVGGGVIGDTAGFAASVFMRGIPFISVPTSLLAMVDASVGGKTGINCPYGKNLIGSFHQPEKIFCCREFLNDLPASEILNGIAEMVKHGILGSSKHFQDLEKIARKNPDIDDVFALVPDSINIKKEVVEADEKEEGVRMYVNLGHTFGHAIELLSDFKMPHGVAVAIGTVMAADYAKKKGICSLTTTKEIRNIFEKFEFDLYCEYSKEEIFEAMKHDKKRKEGKVRLVLPRKIGKVEILEF